MTKVRELLMAALGLMPVASSAAVPQQLRMLTAHRLVVPTLSSLCAMIWVMATSDAMASN